MDWATFTLVIPIGKWIKKQLDIAGRERRVSARETAVAKREDELEALIKLKESNTANIRNLIFLEPDYVSYRLGETVNMADIQVLIRNFSIFDVRLTKLVVQPTLEAQRLATISVVEERTIQRQSSTGILVTHEFQSPMAEHIKGKQATHERVVWDFRMQGYFHSDEVSDFVVEQGKSFTTHP